MLSQFFHCEGNASNTSWWQNQSSAGTLVLPLVLFRQRSKNHQDKFLKRRFPWRFCGLFAVKPAVCKAGRVLRSLMAMFYFAKWGGWSTWRGQVLVLLQNLLRNKSAATDFPASSPLYVQAARKNRRCYISVQNQRRKVNSTQRRIFAGCTKSDFTGKEARLPEQHTGIHKNLNHYEAEGAE